MLSIYAVYAVESSAIMHVGVICKDYLYYITYMINSANHSNN